MRFLEIAFRESAKERVTSALNRFSELEWTITNTQNAYCEIRAMAPADGLQAVLDEVQSALAGEEGWRIAVLPVEASMAPVNTEDETPKKEQSGVSLREEIYQDVSGGAQLNQNFIILTILSAIVAALGLNADNIAAVIGAMVIAPLLGPLLAFSLGSALGDFSLMIRSGRTALAGLAIGFATAYSLAFVIGVNLESKELLDRSTVEFDSIALALASGAAAALSIITGLSSTLVGVMVAVALLPPSVALALFLGAGEFSLALRAALLLGANIISVNLASQIVFFAKGVRPRTWLEERAAKQSRRVNFAVWGGLLAALVLLIMLRAN